MVQELMVRETTEGVGENSKRSPGRSEAAEEELIAPTKAVGRAPKLEI